MAIKDERPQTEEEAAAREMQTQDTPAVDDPPAQDLQPEGDKPAEPEAKGEQDEKPVSPRDRIAKRFAEKRKQDLEGDNAVFGIDDDTGDKDDDKPTEAAKPAETPAEGEKGTPKADGDKPKDTADDPLIKLRVDGRDIELPQSEVVKMAQINTAVSAREMALRDLNDQIARKREEVQKISGKSPGADTNGDRPAAQTPPDPAKPTKLDEARLREIAEDIQSGTPEEAVKALSELVASSQRPEAAPVDVNSIVETASARIKAEQAVEGMVERFKEDFKEIVADDDLLEITINRAAKEMVADLQNTGMSEADLARVAAARPDEIARVHHRFRTHRVNGALAYPNMREMTEIANTSGSYVRDKYVRQPNPEPEPKPKTDLSNRTERKQTLTSQPKTTGHRSQPAAETPAGGKPDPRAAVRRIAAMRRGQRAAV